MTSYNVCMNCGNFYQVGKMKKQRKYCSHSCRQKAYLKRNGLRKKTDQPRVTDVEAYYWERLNKSSPATADLLADHIEMFGVRSGMSALMLLVSHSQRLSQKVG